MKVLPAFKDFFEDKSPLISLFGGRGSGKSYACAQKITMRLLTETPHKILCIHKFERKIKNTIYDQIVDVIKNEGFEDEFEYLISPLEIRCKINGNKIIFFGLDGPKVKSTTGITSCWVEEATFLTENDFRELYLSLRGEHLNYLQIILSYNPIDVNHWINKQFHINKTYKANIYHSTYLDNPFLGDGYEEKLNSNIHDSSYYRMAKFGEWASISEATIFNNWEVYDKEFHKDISLDMEDYEITSGIDFGSTHASSCLLVGKRDNTLVIFDEVYGHRWTNNEFIIQIKARGYNNDFIFYADSAEPARIKEFRYQGLNTVAVKKGKNSVAYSIDFLKRYRIIILPHCKHLIEEIGTYSYLYDERTNTIFNVPNPKQVDDAVSALRYSINKYLPKKSQGMRAVQSLPQLSFNRV